MEKENFKLDYKSIAPFSEQLAGYLRNRIRNGDLKEGDKMPTMREAALLYHLGVATVNKAYQSLIDEGTLESHGRQGVFVSAAELYRDDSITYLISDQELKIAHLLAPVIKYCRESEISLETLIELLSKYYRISPVR